MEYQILIDFIEACTSYKACMTEEFSLKTSFVGCKTKQPTFLIKWNHSEKIRLQQERITKRKTKVDKIKQ